MDRPSTGGMSEDWRKQWLSGQVLGRSSMGAACGEGAGRIQTTTATVDRIGR